MACTPKPTRLKSKRLAIARKKMTLRRALDRHQIGHGYYGVVDVIYMVGRAPLPEIGWTP